MSEQESAKVHDDNAHHDHSHCLCCEAHDAISRVFHTMGGSEEASGHFRESRIEFLKGVRALLDQRIEHLGKPSAKGTRIVVE
jgi:hypothetical protein